MRFFKKRKRDVVIPFGSKDKRCAACPQCGSSKLEMHHKWKTAWECFWYVVLCAECEFGRAGSFEGEENALGQWSAYVLRYKREHRQDAKRDDINKYPDTTGR